MSSASRKRPVTTPASPAGAQRRKPLERGPNKVDLFAEDRVGGWVPTTPGSPLPSAAARSVGQLRLAEVGVAAHAYDVEARPQRRSLRPKLRVGNKDTPAWNTVRKLRCDDDTHDTAAECMESYIKFFLRGEHGRRSRHLHAAAVRDVIRSSQWRPETIVEQLFRFFETSECHDDMRIEIGEPDDDMHGPPILFTVIEELAVEEDGTLYALDKKTKVHRHRAPTRRRCHRCPPAHPPTRPSLLQDRALPSR